MARIHIGVIDPPQNQKTNMEVPDDVDVRSLVEAMVEEMGLPAKGPANRDNQYQLSTRAADGALSLLDPQKTLAQNGVCDGAILQLTVQMTAGGGAPWDEPKQWAGAIADVLEERLLIKIFGRRETGGGEHTTAHGTILARPLFGLPSEDGQYECDAFMLMPFSDQFQSIYVDYIKPVAVRHSIVVKRADDFFTKRNIFDDIWSAIARCRFIIADCTGRNANVFYELGIAHTLGKPTILLTQDIKDLPFDIQGRRVIIYEDRSRGLATLQRKLAEAILTIITSGGGVRERR